MAADAVVAAAENAAAVAVDAAVGGAVAENAAVGPDRNAVVVAVDRVDFGDYSAENVIAAAAEHFWAAEKKMDEETTAMPDAVVPDAVVLAAVVLAAVVLAAVVPDDVVPDAAVLDAA